MLESGIAVRIISAPMIQEGVLLAGTQLTKGEIADGLRQVASQVESGRSSLVEATPAGRA